MKARIVLTWTAAAALLLVTTPAVTTAAATNFEKRTTFTFNAPVAVPGVILPAGSYVFRLANPITGRDVVQVLRADNGTPYAMFFSLRTPRAEAVDKPEIRFMETAADMTPAIHSWWYPADTQGYEFVYPREQARLLATGIGAPVLATAAAVTEPEPEYVWETPPEPAAPVIARAEPALVGEVAEAIEEAPTVVAEEPAPIALPKTDSPTATLVLVGLVSLLSALAVRAARGVA